MGELSALSTSILDRASGDMETKGRIRDWVESMVRRDHAGRFARSSDNRSGADGRGPRFNVVKAKPVPELARLVGKPWHARRWKDVKVDRATHHETGRAYDALPLMDPRSKPSFDAYIAEVHEQYRMLTEDLGITVEVVPEDPYPDVEAMIADLRDNGRIKVLDAASTPPGHPYIDRETTNQFRAVHDAFGHAGTGRGFDRHGEEAAFQAHANVFSPMAVPALASLTRGQNGSLILSADTSPDGVGVFGPQKMALLPERFVTPDMEVDVETYHDAFEGVMGDSEFTHFVTHRTPAEMEDMTPLMRPDGKAGVLIHDHGNGDIEATALFSAPDAPRGAGLAMLDVAVREHGVNYVECYGDALRGLYEKLGFEVVDSSPFADEYAAPGWDYDRHGRPNYYTLRLKK